MMRGNWWKACAVLAAAAIAVALPAMSARAKATAGKGAGKVSAAACYDCHDEIKALKEGSRHAGLACATCHGALNEHLASSDSKPVTIIDQKACGGCHKEQYASFFKTNHEGAARKEKGVPAGRSPMMDKLLAPYGFTFEHNEPRGHAFMVIDQFVVDRFQGGRFQFKRGAWGMDESGKTWDVLTDTGKTLPETAKAGNPTCIQCKTSDHLLKWKYLGDKDPKAQWDRTSDIVAVAKDTNNPVGCVHCHDPHGAKPRVVRDALIEAISAKGAKMFDKGGKTDLRVVSFRDGFRKIGVMEKTDSRMMCAQCHVEYACGAGTQFSDGKKVGYEDVRTNYFPLEGPLGLLERYKKQDFFDFRHAVTGARLVKLQHPEAETYSGSVHDKAGIQCHQCHMPKVRKGGKTYTDHGVVRPKNHVKESCAGCHPKATLESKAYQIEGVQNYIRGKMRKSEYWLGQLIDAYAAAKRAGVPEDVLAKARGKHEEAHVLWEWWTAENSDGFHNPELARESLAQSISASKEGVKLLNEAIEARK
jgi:formate-dependent nitrite reductase cytochrome c552 subunit